MRDGLISEIGHSLSRPDDAEVIDLSARTVAPGFIDNHVHLTIDASDLARQTLRSSAAKALKARSLACECNGFKTASRPASGLSSSESRSIAQPTLKAPATVT